MDSLSSLSSTSPGRRTPTLSLLLLEVSSDEEVYPHHCLVVFTGGRFVRFSLELSSYYVKCLELIFVMLLHE